MRDFQFEDLLKSYRARIVRLGWTQKKVAEELGVGERTYQGWEDGERLPSSKMLNRIVSFFQLTDAEANDFYRAAAQVAPEIHNLPFQRNHLFTGRKMYLEQLDQSLQENGDVAITQPISISGLGGIGKTQLALEYAYRCYSKEYHTYRTILWVNAADQTTIEQSYLSLAHLLKLPEKDEDEVNCIVQAVKIWLEEHTSWLLILDNADDLQLVNAFLPAKRRGHILLTTRSQIVGNIAVPIMIEEMSSEEGLRFLLLRSGFAKPRTEIETIALTIREAAAQLVELLGGHPLALDQAGAYIEETGVSFNTYIQLYNEQRRLLLEERGSIGYEHPESVFVTFGMSFKKACELSPTSTDVLYFCSFLHPDSIPEELFSQENDLKLTPLMFNKAIRALRRYSLIKRDDEKKLLSVHRLVQAVLRDELDEQTCQQWATRSIKSVNRAFPRVAIANWSDCRRYLPHVQVCLDLVQQQGLIFPEAGDLFFQAGRYLYEQGQYKEAKRFYENALKIYEDVLEPKPIATTVVLHHLAILAQIQERHDDAEMIYKRVLSITEQLFGSLHSTTLSVLNNLAIVYQNQGKDKEAEQLFQHVLNYRGNIHESEDPNTAITLHNTALLYREQGDYNKAEQFLCRSLKILEETLGPIHPSTARTLDALANIYQLQHKNIEEVEPLYKRSLHIKEQVLGLEHPDIAITLHDLTMLLLWSEQGREAEGKELFERAIHLVEQSFGPDSPQTIEYWEEYYDLFPPED